MPSLGDQYIFNSGGSLYAPRNFPGVANSFQFGGGRENATAFAPTSTGGFWPSVGQGLGAIGGSIGNFFGRGLGLLPAFGGTARMPTNSETNNPPMYGSAPTTFALPTSRNSRGLGGASGLGGSVLTDHVAGLSGASADWAGEIRKRNII